MNNRSITRWCGILSVLVILAVSFERGRFDARQGKTEEPQVGSGISSNKMEVLDYNQKTSDKSVPSSLYAPETIEKVGEKNLNKKVKGSSVPRDIKKVSATEPVASFAPMEEMKERADEWPPQRVRHPRGKSHNFNKDGEYEINWKIPPWPWFEDPFSDEVFDAMLGKKVSDVAKKTTESVLKALLGKEGH